MNCDGCNKLIGNTLYEIGSEGMPNYHRLCAVCWLGVEEGSKPKYNQHDASWTVVNLAVYKTKPWGDDKADAKNWSFSHKDVKWTRNEVVIDGDPL